MSDVDESDFCPDPADYDSGEPDAAREFGNAPDDIDNMVVVAVPAGPAKVVDAKSEKESERESVWNKLIDLSCRAHTPTSSFVIHAEKILGERLFFCDHAFMTESEVCEYRSSGATPYRISHFQARQIEKLWLMHNPPEPTKAHNYKCGTCGHDFGDNHLELEEHIKHNSCGHNEVKEEYTIDPSELEDLSIQDHERFTLFERQCVLHLVNESAEFSEEFKKNLGLKLSIYWESV
jgi:hypothetical protein